MISMSTESLRSRAWDLYRGGDFAAGRDLFTQALAQDPADYDALLGLGRCHRLLGAYAAAVDDFTRAHDVEPGRARPLCERGAILILLERYDESLADYELAREVEPDYPTLDSYFAEIYLYLGRFDEALAASERGLEFGGDRLMSTLNIAHARLFLGDMEGAIDLYGDLAQKVHPGKRKSMQDVILNDFRLFHLSRLTCAGLPEVEARLAATFSGRTEFDASGSGEL
jgi:tetratricopeptide (TPR) repeat protein